MVKQASQTYLLSLTRWEFENITLAIMLHSNKSHKLQGFGQCIARWLAQWSAGELPMAALRPAQDIDDLQVATHRIYVGLAGETVQLFKAWRSALVEASALPVPVGAAVLALVACFLAQHHPESA